MPKSGIFSINFTLLAMHRNGKNATVDCGEKKFISSRHAINLTQFRASAHYLATACEQ